MVFTKRGGAVGTCRLPPALCWAGPRARAAGGPRAEHRRVLARALKFEFLLVLHPLDFGFPKPLPGSSQVKAQTLENLG